MFFSVGTLVGRAFSGFIGRHSLHRIGTHFWTHIRQLLEVRQGVSFFGGVKMAMVQKPTKKFNHPRIFGVKKNTSTTFHECLVFLAMLDLGPKV